MKVAVLLHEYGYDHRLIGVYESPETANAAFESERNSIQDGLRWEIEGYDIEQTVTLEKRTWSAGNGDQDDWQALTLLRNVEIVK